MTLLSGCDDCTSMGERAANVAFNDPELKAAAAENFSGKTYSVSTHWSGIDGAPCVPL